MIKEWAPLKSNRSDGFTIVELLIVIVVIGILAAITIVAFNGVQDRAKWSSLQSDLSSINKAVLVYYAENGSYPATATYPGWSWRYSCASGISGNAFIPNISTVTTNLKQAPCTGASNNDDTWIYGSDGVEYKLLHIRPNFSAATRDLVSATMRDNRWSSSNSTYGYWSAGAATR